MLVSLVSYQSAHELFVAPLFPRVPPSSVLFLRPAWDFPAVKFAQRSHSHFLSKLLCFISTAWKQSSTRSFVRFFFLSGCSTFSVDPVFLTSPDCSPSPLPGGPNQMGLPRFWRGFTLSSSRSSPLSLEVFPYFIRGLNHLQYSLVIQNSFPVSQDGFYWPPSSLPPPCPRLRSPSLVKFPEYKWETVCI